MGIEQNATGTSIRSHGLCLRRLRERLRMDATSTWLHNINVDRTLQRLGTYVDPRKRAALFKFLIEEEDQLGSGPDQLADAARRVREGKARITRTRAIIEGLNDCGLMDQETFSRALGVLSTMRETQALIEQRYRGTFSQCSEAPQRRSPMLRPKHP
jgi:hypothetical protein